MKINVITPQEKIPDGFYRGITTNPISAQRILRSLIPSSVVNDVEVYEQGLLIIGNEAVDPILIPTTREIVLLPGRYVTVQVLSDIARSVLGYDPGVAYPELYYQIKDQIISQRTFYGYRYNGTPIEQVHFESLSIDAATGMLF